MVSLETLHEKTLLYSFSSSKDNGRLIDSRDITCNIILLYYAVSELQMMHVLAQIDETPTTRNPFNEHNNLQRLIGSTSF